MPARDLRQVKRHLYRSFNETAMASPRLSLGVEFLRLAKNRIMV